MGGGSPSPSPSPVGSPRGHNNEGDLTNAFNNCRIQPSDPGSSAAAAAAVMPTIFGGYPPFSGFRSPYLKHKLKCHFKIKHRHHGPPKIKHRHHEHIKIKHRHHKHKHGGEKEMHRFPHCHHMNTEAPLGCRVLHQGPHHHGPRPHPPGHPPHHHMRERHHGHCCSHGYHHFFTDPMGGPGPGPVPVPVPVPPPHN